MCVYIYIYIYIYNINLYINVLLHKTAHKLNFCTDVVASGYWSKQFLQTEQLYLFTGSCQPLMQSVGDLCVCNTVHAGGLWKY